jgi:6-phosphogluconolactonase
MGTEVRHFENATTLATAVAARWMDELIAQKNAQVPYSVALSGGRIAKNLFAEAARLAAARSYKFEGVHFFWGDERCVPPSSPDSNYAEAYGALLEPIGVPAGRIHRLQGELKEALALETAIGDICSVVPLNSAGQPVLDLIFLGMGEDGHVASLFPGEPEGVRNDPAIFRAVTAVKPPPRRITLGYAAIMAARQVWVLASGAGKDAALGESLAPTGQTPLARVLLARSDTTVFTDIGGDKR